MSTSQPFKRRMTWKNLLQQKFRVKKKKRSGSLFRRELGVAAMDERMEDGTADGWFYLWSDRLSLKFQNDLRLNDC